MKATDIIFQSYNSGDRFVVMRGRSLFDLTVDCDGKITSILEEIRIEALKKELILLTYSKSEGLEFDTGGLHKNDIQDIDNVLKQYGVPGIGQNNNCSYNDESITFIRRVLKLAQLKEYPSFRDGRAMKFMFVVVNAENICPEMQPGSHTENQMVAIELASKLSNSIGLRKSGCFVLFSEEKEGTLDSVLTRDIKILRLPQPDKEEKSKFFEACRKRYPNMQVDPDLSDDVIINTTINTPNKSLEKLCFASDSTGLIITPAELFKKKQEDVIKISEGTLEAIDFKRINSTKLVGRNIERPFQIIKSFSDSLKNGEKTAFRNLLLCGAPSTGKTDLAILATKMSGIQAYVLNSPKSGIVGESERKGRNQINSLRENVGIYLLDEVEMVFPMNRNIQSGDGGVTQYLMGLYQSFLSDSSLNGRCGIIATSNKPDSISDAMRSRWNILPVLMTLMEDYPSILISIAQKLFPEFEGEETNPFIIEAAENFYYSGASPRDMEKSIIASIAFIKGELSIEHLVFASKDKIPSGKRLSYIHSELSSIKYCDNVSLLPWWDIVNNQPYSDYPFPLHIKQTINSNTLPNIDEIDRYLKEIEPYANV